MYRIVTVCRLASPDVLTRCADGWPCQTDLFSTVGPAGRRPTNCREVHSHGLVPWVLDTSSHSGRFDQAAYLRKKNSCYRADAPQTCWRTVLRILESYR